MKTMIKRVSKKKPDQIFKIVIVIIVEIFKKHRESLQRNEGENYYQ